MKFELIVSMDEKGNVSVNGPIENKIVCYGMLEVARQAVEKFDVQKKTIQPVTTNEFEAARRRQGV
jgi:hypothetical protein